MNTQEKHLIIGAGPVGLGAAQALKEWGIPYDQVDASRSVGGNWYHGVYETAHIISSRKVTQYDNFPMPADYPDFPSRQNMLDYLNAYADHFNLRENITFNTKVLYVRPVENSLWEVTLDHGEMRLYKGVLCCNGHHWSKDIPHFEGQFSGKMLHSKDYKSPDQLRGRRVLVIGAGNSAMDIASEAARVASFAAISLRSGVWLLPKTAFGLPFTDFIKPWMPIWFQRLLLRAIIRVVVGNYETYGLPKPDHRIFEKHPTISTEVLHYFKHGRLKARRGVRCLDGDHVEFTDGVREAYDLIITATGYQIDYPFLPRELVRVQGKHVLAYASAMYADYKGLYLLGWAQPRGGFGSLVTPGMHLLARVIKLQEEISIPVGLVMKSAGEKLPDTHLIDPHQLQWDLRRAKVLFPVLRWWAKRLDRKHPGFQNEVLPAPEKLEPGIQVF